MSLTAHLAYALGPMAAIVRATVRRFRRQANEISLCLYGPKPTLKRFVERLGEIRRMATVNAHERR